MGAGPDGGRQLSPGSKMKCCGSPTRDPDPAGSPCPRRPRPALAGPRAGSAPQPGAAQAATAVRSPRLLGPRPQLCSAAAVAWG